MSVRKVVIDLDRLRQLAAGGASLVAMAAEFRTSAYTVRSRMVEAGIERNHQGRPRRAEETKRQVGGRVEGPPARVMVGRTHHPCGICQELVELGNGCGHWRPVAVGSHAKALVRRESDRRKQRRHRAAVAERVAAFKRKQGLT